MVSRDPLCCTVSPKIAHFKALWELALAHVDPRWLKIALNHLFELLKLSRNNFEKNHFHHFWTHSITLL